MTDLRIAVVGTGYVGLTTAACLAHIGRQVIAIDVDHRKVASLSAGSMPIVERDLAPLVTEGLASGRLRFSSDPAAGATADIVLLCLPTPHADHAGPDLSYLKTVAGTLRTTAKSGAVIVTKSTVPVGTHRELGRWIGRADLPIAANPEFLREGTAVSDFLNPDRIVIGCDDDRITEKVVAMYAGIDAPMVRCDPFSAELIKYASNTFLATKVSFVNELSRLCDELGADIDAVVRGVGSDPRIGDAFLTPGPGWGGSCFPKDTRALAHAARQVGRRLPVIESAFTSNLDHFAHITSAIERACPTRLDRARLAVWGLSFKADTDDIRDSPAIEIVDRLAGRGALITAYDPALDLRRQDQPTVHRLERSPESACQDADMLVVLTEWPEFGRVDLEAAAHRLSGKVVYDARHIIDPVAAADAGLHLVRPGKPG